MPRRALILAVALLATATAHADAGERALGLELAGGYPPGGRARLVYQEGLNDSLALRLAAGAHFSALDEELILPGLVSEGIASAGIAIAFDVFAWVPEIYLGAGAAFGQDGVRGRIIASLGVRRYVSMDWFLTFGVIGEWTPEDEGVVLGSFGIGWLFDDGT